MYEPEGLSLTPQLTWERYILWTWGPTILEFANGLFDSQSIPSSLSKPENNLCASMVYRPM